MKQQRADAVAETVEQAPVGAPRRQQSAAHGVDDDHQPKPVEQRVERALQPGIGNVEDVERVDDRLQREQRQRGEHQDRPGGGQRPAQAARRGRASRSRAMTRRAIHCSGAQSARIASATARRPNACAAEMRAARPCSQSPSSVPTALASPGDSRATSTHSSGLTRLDERAKVWRAKRSRRAALIRELSSSICNSIARAERTSASSASCFCLLGGQLGARRVAERRLLRFGRQFDEPLAAKPRGAARAR